MELWNVDQRKRALLDELQGLDVAEEQALLFEEEKLRRVVFTMELEKTTLLEVCSSQKSRVL